MKKNKFKYQLRSFSKLLLIMSKINASAASTCDKKMISLNHLKRIFFQIKLLSILVFNSLGPLALSLSLLGKSLEIPDVK